MRIILQPDPLDTFLTNGLTLVGGVCLATLCLAVWDRELTLHFAPVGIAGGIGCLLTYIVMAEDERY